MMAFTRRVATFAVTAGVLVSFAALAASLAQRKSLVELTDACCHWPVGEVGAPSFFFCGGVAVEGGPYCPAHSKRAFAGRPQVRSENRWLNVRW